MEHFELMADANRSGIAFLFAELGLASTFLDIAKSTKVAETAKRNQNNARIAYDTVGRIFVQLRPSEAERGEINKLLAALRSRLEEFGERF